MEHKSETDVLIVGAGPTGLTAALVLAHYGIDFTIIDTKSGPSNRSKALAVQARTLELFQKLDIAENFIEAGVKTTSFNILIKGRKTAQVSLGNDGEVQTPFPYILMLEQSKTERLLIEALAAQGKSVAWKSDFLGLELTQSGIKATTRTAQYQQTIHAKWVIGADGASSPVRHALDIPFKGGTYEQNFFLADTAIKWEHKSNGLFINLTPKGFIGFFPMAGQDRYRVFGSITGTAKEKETLAFEDIENILQTDGHIDAQLTDPNWVSSYKLHHRMATQFRQGKVFLAGDAAHIHSPAGGQGMNTGIQDAYNLAWKLALVIQTKAQPALLDSYESERIPVAKALLQGTDRIFSIVTSPSAIVRILRLHIAPHLLAFAMKQAFASKKLFSMASQIAINYRKSIFTKQTTTTQFRAGDRFSSIQIFDSTKGISFHCITQKPLGNDLKQLIQSYAVPISFLELNHSDAKLEEDTLVLVRPDGYIAYSGKVTDLSSLDAFLAQWFVKL